MASARSPSALHDLSVLVAYNALRVFGGRDFFVAFLLGVEIRILPAASDAESLVTVLAVCFEVGLKEGDVVFDALPSSVELERLLARDPVPVRLIVRGDERNGRRVRLLAVGVELVDILHL